MLFVITGRRICQIAADPIDGRNLLCVIDEKGLPGLRRRLSILNFDTSPRSSPQSRSFLREKYDDAISPEFISSVSDLQSASTRAGHRVLVPEFSDFAARIGFDACVGIKYHRRPTVCVIGGPMGNAWIIRIAGFGEVDPN